jgi:hypothetical protein
MTFSPEGKKARVPFCPLGDPAETCTLCFYEKNRAASLSRGPHTTHMIVNALHIALRSVPPNGILTGITGLGIAPLRAGTVNIYDGAPTLPSTALHLTATLHSWLLHALLLGPLHLSATLHAGSSHALLRIPLHLSSALHAGSPHALRRGSLHLSAAPHAGSAHALRRRSLHLSAALALPVSSAALCAHGRCAQGLAEVDDDGVRSRIAARQKGGGAPKTGEVSLAGLVRDGGDGENGVKGRRSR